MSLKLVPPREGRSQHWRIRGTIKGQYIDESTGVSSQARAEEIRIKRENELLDQAIFGAKATTTFAVAAVSYLESRQPKGMQRYAIAGWNENSPCLMKDFGETLVNRIDQAKVNEVIAKRYRGKKPGTIVRNFLTPLTAVLHHAANQGWCDTPKPFTRPKFNDKRNRWASYEEADRLLQHAAPHVRPLILFLIQTGCRMAEAIDLKWEDINFEARWLVFCKTKWNEEPRGVPIHQQLATVLQQLPNYGASPDSPVFLTDRGEPYTDREREEGGQIKTAWRGACRRAGIVNLRLHDLRHTFATWGLMLRVDARIQKEIQGHARTDMGSRYAHVPNPEAIAEIDRFPFRWFEQETAREWRSKRQPRTKRQTRGKSVESVAKVMASTV
jgi:integrase